MKSSPGQLTLLLSSSDAVEQLDVASGKKDKRINQLEPHDRPFHDWYRFVLSFPPHLVRKYLDDFGLKSNHVVLDPFCGTGTTLVESKLNGIRAIGLEANPFAHFASSVKVDWEIDPDLLKRRAHDIAYSVAESLCSQGIDDNQPFEASNNGAVLRTLGQEAERLLITDSISPVPLHKALVLLEHLRDHQSERYYRHALLALANALVFKISNLNFGPEVGVDRQKKDIPVVACWLSEISKIAEDLRRISGKRHPGCEVHLSDAREISSVIPHRSIDAVITSPPYPNEKDYSRTTRLESVLLGFIKNKADLRKLKKQLVRSNTRGVYKEDDDHKWISDHPKIQHIAELIEKRRIELGKTSGFERLYPRVTKLYFGGMARHLAELRDVLRPNAKLAYVVGDQASYLRVLIPTGKLLAEIAGDLGYELIRTDLFRTRFATATKEQLHEEVVVLRWSGKKK
ncbi:MAG: DNA methyltransferase [Candidatus Lindowbacteria bacterium]|nr:DNA methyltransferase [Candidatus Lindowbacteria bacterium]